MIDWLTDAETYTGEDHLPKFAFDEVLKHCDKDSCWITINDRVYDITDFLEEHKNVRMHFNNLPSPIEN